MDNKTRVATDILDQPYRTEDNIYLKEVEALRGELKEANARCTRLEKSYKYEEEQRVAEAKARADDKEEYDRLLRNPRRYISLAMIWFVELFWLLSSVFFIAAPWYCMIVWHIQLEILWLTLLGVLGLVTLYMHLLDVNEKNTKR